MQESALAPQGGEDGAAHDLKNKNGWSVTSRSCILVKNVYAFMLTDSCCLRAFSSALALAALLR